MVEAQLKPAISNTELARRYVIFTCGILITALGIALITKSRLGTPPITSISYVLTFIFPLSLGAFTFIINMAMILGQIVLLKKNFPKVQYLQIVMTIIFSYFIDVCMYLLRHYQVNGYLSQISTLLAGCIILAFGISLEVLAGVLMLAGEGIVKAIAIVLSKEFGIVKTVFDVTLVATSMLVSIIYLGKVEGLREGTVIAALTVGMMSRFFRARLGFLLPKKSC